MSRASISEFHPATVWELLGDALGDAPVILQGDRVVTWRELDDAASALAGRFEAAGVGLGSSVATYLYSSPEFLITYLAAWKLRARPVNVSYRYRSQELAHLLE